jgi:hypothetical protein
MELTRSIIDFLDAHEFNKFELGDIDYISDKINNYFDLILNDEITESDARDLAKQYKRMKKYN